MKRLLLSSAIFMSLSLLAGCTDEPRPVIITNPFKVDSVFIIGKPDTVFIHDTIYRNKVTNIRNTNSVNIGQ